VVPVQAPLQQRRPCGRRVGLDGGDAVAGGGGEDGSLGVADDVPGPGARGVPRRRREEGARLSNVCAHLRSSPGNGLRLRERMRKTFGEKRL